MSLIEPLLKPYYVEWQKKPDITSVLKFIEDKLNKNQYIETTIKVFRIMEIRDKYRFYDDFIRDLTNRRFRKPEMEKKHIRIFSIKNCPLNFYTKTEITDLENLLTKLKGIW